MRSDWEEALDDPMTTREVAIRLALTRRRVQQLADAGRLTHTQTPLGRLFARQDVETYAEGRKPTAA